MGILFRFIFFIEVPVIAVSMTDTLPTSQANSAKYDGEIAQEKYSPSEIFQELKTQSTIFEPDTTGYYCNWKHARSTDKGFHQHESSNCHQKAL